MGRKSTVDWSVARAKREAGATFKSLAEEFNVDAASICRRAKKEQWLDPVDSEAVVQRRAMEKVNGIVNADPIKKAEAIDSAASKVADVVERHRTEWEEHKDLVQQAIVAQDFEVAKLAKITAETLKIRQEGERKAWGLDDAAKKLELTGKNGGPVQVVASSLDEAI
jgi:hypothetical protein